MKRKLLLLTVYALVTLLIISGIAIAASPMGTGFTYQGFLKYAGEPANAAYDLEFRLYDADIDGSLIGSIITKENVNVSNGLFTVQLDFGTDAFTGDARWLGIGVRPGADTGPYTELNPRQPLTPAPYALHATTANTVTLAMTSTYAITAENADLLDGQPGAYYQPRVSGTCAVGSTIRAVNVDGTVVCQVDAPLNRSNAPAANTITTLDSIGESGFSAEITIGVDGLGLISFGGSFTNSDLKVAHCNDIACTSATISTIDSIGSVGHENSIAIGSDGLGLISYYDVSNGDLKVAHCSNIICTTATITTLDSTGNIGSANSITIGADGLGLISYRDISNGNLKVAHCDDLACTTASVTTLDNRGDVGTWTSVAIGADGLGLISYMGEYQAGVPNGALRVAHCDNAACTSATLTTLDNGAYIAEYDVSVTIGIDGLGLISYWNATQDDLMVAHCSNAACTSAITTTLDSGGGGSFSSVAIGADGLGVISYRLSDGSKLKVAHCSDIACTAATSVDLSNISGSVANTAITIGVDGLPIIVYRDNSADDLKVLHCSNPFCLPYFRRR
jgi:hypothetical protein